MKQLKITFINTETYAGAHIDKVKVEASELAKSNNCQVKFTHNGKTFIADGDGNVAQVTIDIKL